MTAQNAGNRYHLLVIGTHWLTFALLIAVYAMIELREFFPKGGDVREVMKTWHYMLGLAAFGVVFVRMVLVRFFRAPPIEPAPPAWQQRLAAMMHVALYAFLIVAPLAGWLALSAKGTPIPFFGMELPALIAQNKALARTLKEIHEAIGVFGYYLIGVHALAALFHHYFMHDNTLRRMSLWKEGADGSAHSGARPLA